MVLTCFPLNAKIGLDKSWWVCAPSVDCSMPVALQALLLSPLFPQLKAQLDYQSTEPAHPFLYYRSWKRQTREAFCHVLCISSLAKMGVTSMKHPVKAILNREGIKVE